MASTSEELHISDLCSSQWAYIAFSLVLKFSRSIEYAFPAPLFFPLGGGPLPFLRSAIEIMRPQCCWPKNNPEPGEKAKKKSNFWRVNKNKSSNSKE